MFWFLNEQTMERSFHQPLSNHAHAAAEQRLWCVQSVVLSKTNACVSERKVVCSVEEKWRLSCNYLRKVLFSLKCRASGRLSQHWQGFMQLIILVVYLVSSSQEHALGVVLSRSTSKSRRGFCSNSSGVLDQKTTITQYTSWCFSTTCGSTCLVSWLGWSHAVVQEGRWSGDCCAWSGWQCLPTSSIPAILFLNFMGDAL